MTLELERAPQADGVANARLGTLKTSKSDAERGSLADRLRAGGVQHEDMRDWLEQVDALGELRVLEGVDWQENIGRIAARTDQRARRAAAAGGEPRLARGH